MILKYPSSVRSSHTHILAIRGCCLLQAPLRKPPYPLSRPIRTCPLHRLIAGSRSTRSPRNPWLFILAAAAACWLDRHERWPRNLQRPRNILGRGPYCDFSCSSNAERHRRTFCTGRLPVTFRLPFGETVVLLSPFWSTVYSSVLERALWNA